MLYFTLSLLCVALAAACNAVMDTATHHFSSSILPQTDFWNAETSWRLKYVQGNPEFGRARWLFGYCQKPVQITDAWHLFKTMMIIFVCAAMAFGASADVPYFNRWTEKGVIFALSGMVWNTVFSLFYDKTLRKKESE